MKNKSLRNSLMIIIAMLLCVASLIGCQKKPSNQDESKEQEYVQLLSFESYEEITGTKLRVDNIVGRMSINKDKHYLTEGKGSLKVEVQGEYGEPELHPMLQFDCADTTIPTSNFSKMSDISIDLYNNTDKELHINLAVTALNIWEETEAMPEVTYTLQPRAWTTCTYELTEEIEKAYFDLSNVRFITVTFLEHKESKDDIMNEIYLDNLVGTYAKEEIEIAQLEYDFYEGITFDNPLQQYLVKGGTKPGENLNVISRVSYAEEGIEVDESLGEYGVKGVSSKSVWPGFNILFQEQIPKGTLVTMMLYLKAEDPGCGYAIGGGGVEQKKTIYNEWFEVSFFTNDVTDYTWVFFNFDENPADTNYVPLFGDKEVTMYIDNIKLTPDVSDVSVAEDGTVTITNLAGASGFTYSWNTRLKKGEGFAFEIDFKPAVPVTIWVKAEGKWNLWEGNNLTEENEFFARTFPEWSGKQTIKGAVTRDVEFIEIQVSYVGQEDYSKNVCTISNIRKANVPLPIQELADGTVIVNNSSGALDRYYDIPLSLKAGKTLKFDIDFNTSDPVILWVLANGTFAPDDKTTEMYAQVFGQWTGKRTISVDIQKDVSFVRIYMRYEGGGDTSNRVCTIKNITVKDTPVLPEGAVKKPEGLVDYYETFKVDVKKGQHIKFDLTFETEEQPIVFLYQDGQEVHAQILGNVKGTRTVTVPAEKTVTSSELGIRLRFGSPDVTAADVGEKIFKISNIRAVDPVELPEGAVMKVDGEVDYYATYPLDVKKGQHIKFDLTFETEEQPIVFLYQNGQEIHAQILGSVNGTRTVTVPADKTLTSSELGIRVRFGSPDVNAADRGEKIFKISNIKAVDAATLPEGAVMKVEGEVDYYATYPLNVQAGQEIKFDLTFETEEQPIVFLYQNGQEIHAQILGAVSGTTTVTVPANKTLTSSELGIRVRFGSPDVNAADKGEKIFKITNLQAVSSAVVPDGTHVIENPSGNSDVYYDIQQPMTAGTTCSFDIDFNTSEYLTIWVMANGTSDVWESGQIVDKNEYHAQGYSDWNGKKTISVTLEKDVSFLRIYVRYDGTTDAKTKVCTISNIVVTPAVVIPEGWVEKPAGEVDYYNTYNVDMKAGDTVTFDLTFDTTESPIVFVYADGSEIDAQILGAVNGKITVTVPADKTVTATELGIRVRFGSPAVSAADTGKKVFKLDNIQSQSDANTPNSGIGMGSSGSGEGGSTPW